MQGYASLGYLYPSELVFKAPGSRIQGCCMKISFNFKSETIEVLWRHPCTRQQKVAFCCHHFREWKMKAAFTGSAAAAEFPREGFCDTET